MKIKNVRILNGKELGILNEQMGKACFCTDLARVTDVEFDNSTGFGNYWFIADAKNNTRGQDVSNYIDKKGNNQFTKKGEYKSGVRLVIPFDSIEDLEDLDINNLSFNYPITNMGGRIKETIDKLFDTRSKLILKTGNKHFVNGNLYDEYEAFGMRFIKLPNKAKNKNVILTDGTVAKDNYVYLRVEEVPLIPCEEAAVFYTTNILFGTTYDKNCRDFSKSTLCEYLNGEFLNSINGEFNVDQKEILFDDINVNNTNRYGFNIIPLTEEEILEICVQAHISVFLHGMTGTGKTERVVALDNNLELVDFGCTSSEGFTGIVAKDFNSKELFLYDPFWYKSITKKCEDEPEYLHILFLEELLNAKNDLQKVAFEVTLNKTLTNSGFRLELPKNCVVVAAGNEASESKSANEMSEPLFGRFAHVYINTNSEDWLKWALKRKKEGKRLLYKEPVPHERIHPAIIDYIAINGDKVLRTPYNGVTPNADPRKWALASKALYESNNPNVLRAFVGDEITKDFIKFCQINIITIDDVINDRVTSEDVSFDPSIRWYSTIILSRVDDDNVDKVREFVRGLGHEFLAVFDYEWSKGSDERIMRLYGESLGVQKKRLVPYGNTGHNK